MMTLKDILPANADTIIYVFYDFKNTQKRGIRTRRKYTCLTASVCNRFVRVRGRERKRNCLRCSKRRYSFWDDTVGDLLTYLLESRPWANEFVAIAHNAKTFDTHFILNRAILLQ